MARCEACYADVLWLRHETTGVPAPIDRTPSKDGNCLILPGSGTYRIVPPAVLSILQGDLTMFSDPAYTVAADAIRDGGLTRTKSHFATCTHPEHFRSCRKCHHTPCQCPQLVAT